MKKVLLNLYNWFARPFKKEYRFFLLLFFVFGLINSFGYVLFNSLEKTFGILCHHFLLTYLLTMVYSYLNGKVRIIYRTVILVLMSLSLIIDLACVNAFHYTYTRDTVSVLLGTNTTEIKEMWDTYFSFSILFQTILMVAVAYCVYRLMLLLVKHKREIILKVAMLALLVDVVGFIYISRTWSAWRYISITRFFLIQRAVDSPDLHQYLHHPKFKYLSQRPLPNIVLIIGESFSKSHSSLYGYEKNTNPLLSGLQKDSMLYVFSDVTSPATHTIESFQSIMSTYKPEYGERVKWYECLTVPEVMHSLGYHCCWISNQNRYGLYDNLVTKYADLCDTTIFLRNSLKDNEKTFYDESLLPKMDVALLAEKGTRSFYVVHLMGSHSKFNKRYPAQFNRFSPSDYAIEGEKQKRNISHYDNSILYNDSVVYEIMQRYGNSNTMVYYFSDHGLDVYQTRPDYVGHAIDGNTHSEKIGRAIPFMVYMSKEFQKQNPDICEKIKQIQSKPFNTQDMLDLLMETLDVRIVD